MGRSDPDHLEDFFQGNGLHLRDKATRAWNFATALYFKAGGVPWRGHGLESDTCYIGITFYQSENSAGKTVMRSGVAQAFDYLGQGVVLRVSRSSGTLMSLESHRTCLVRQRPAS